MRNIKYEAATKHYSYSQLIQKCDESVLYRWNVVSKTRYVVKDIFDPIYAEYCYCLRLSWMNSLYIRHLFSANIFYSQHPEKPRLL